MSRTVAFIGRGEGAGQALTPKDLGPAADAVRSGGVHAELGLRAAESYASYAERKGRTALLTLNRPQAVTRATADQKEGMSAFVGRRPVEFRHR